MKKTVNVSILLVLLYISNVYAKPQLPEINDQYETTNSSATIKTNSTLQRNITAEENEIITSELRIKNTTSEQRNDQTETSVVSNVPIHTKFYRAICVPIDAFLSAPKVIVVLRNIGTCIVNGAMELISFYFPAPLIPLIASAAGMVIPFEPVVMLRDKMPVNSYRRAFMSAMNSFLGTFDKFKIDDNFVDDPYMMQRFNRRFMNDPPKDKELKVDGVDGII